MGDRPAQVVVEEQTGGSAAVAPVLSVRELRVHFPVRSGLLRRVTGVARAVDGVSFEIARGETLGLVGESGCGKTTVGRAILRLIEPTSGVVELDGVDVGACSGDRLRRMRRGTQIVFQDPAGSLNPRMRVGEIVGEPLLVHRLVRGRAARRARALELLAKCGLPDAGAADRYPHEFSGGQKQRIAIARALATGPRLLVCDEPTSALDVSIQAQILNLLKDLRRDLGLAMLFISHDMGVVAHMCDRIAVMRAGRIVEMGMGAEVISSPREGYTRELLAAVPGRNEEVKRWSGT
jgi:peptide/nickel transport system ATP-binding protein